MISWGISLGKRGTYCMELASLFIIASHSKNVLLCRYGIISIEEIIGASLFLGCARLLG